MSGTQKIYYIGAKPVKEDNVLNRKHIRWRGYGASAEVPVEDAAVYLRYPAVWADEETFKALQADKAKTAKSTVVTSTDGAGGAGGKSTKAGAGKADGAGGAGDGDGADRETLVKAAILQLDPSKDEDYTGQGRPRVNRIVDILGTNVGADEIDAAFRSLKHDGKLK